MSNRIVIEAGKRGTQYWKDVWSYRGLFWFLAWRDYIVRYKQAVVGVAWSVLRPLITIVVFTFLFGKIGKFPTGSNVDYALIVSAGTLAWQLFANLFSDSSSSLVGNSNLLTKVYFPRIIIPASTVIISLIDFGFSLIIFAGVCVWYHFIPDYRIIFLPLFILFAIVAAMGAGLLFSALFVKYRDFRFIIPFVVQFGLFVAPVGVESSVILNGNYPLWVKYAYCANPMVAVIDGFRWSLLRGGAHIWWPGFWTGMATTIILVVVGTAYFRKTEKTFADVI